MTDTGAIARLRERIEALPRYVAHATTVGMRTMQSPDGVWVYLDDVRAALLDPTKTCYRYSGSDGTLCAQHNERFASPTAMRCAARLSVADGPGPEERSDLEAVYAVVFSNYDPAETDSLWRDKAKAEARAEELNSGKTTGWDVVKWTLSDAALPIHREETGR